MVQADIQKDTDLWSRWCRLTYNKTLIYEHDGAGWHTTRHWSTITMVQADIQQHTDLRLTYKTLIYGWHTTTHWSTITMVQASRHVVSELTGCYSWLTGCREQGSPAQNAISGLKMSTVITGDWPREWTCSIPADPQQCTDLWSRLLWTSKMISWSILYCIVQWKRVLHVQ